MPHTTVGNSSATTAGLRPPRPRIMRSVVFLLISAGALLIFIALLGDWRREHNVLAQLETYADSYASRMSKGAVLPLNLELDVSPDPQSRLMDAWLSRADAGLLRGSSHAVLVAWTVRVPRVLGSHGRGVILFAHGRFDVKWVALRQFDDLLKEQSAELRRLATLPS